MTTWTRDELSTISAADELEIAPLRRDGTLRKGVPIWVVRDGDELYVRSWRGRGGAWFRAAQASHAGRIRAGSLEKDVTFVAEADPGINDQIDAAYRVKYRRSASYVPPMISAQARHDAQARAGLVERVIHFVPRERRTAHGYQWCCCRTASCRQAARRWRRPSAPARQGCACRRSASASAAPRQ